MLIPSLLWFTIPQYFHNTTILPSLQQYCFLPISTARCFYHSNTASRHVDWHIGLVEKRRILTTLAQKVYCLKKDKHLFGCISDISEALKRDLISLILMGKLGISHQNSDKGCNCKLFFLLLPFHFALLPASVSLSYLHFFTNIDFIQEQKCFSFWTRQILISTFTHPNTSTFPFTVNYSFLQIYSKFLPLSVFYVTPIPL